MHIAAVPIASDFTVVIAAGCKDDADNQRSQNIDARRYDFVIHSVSNYEFFVPCFKASALGTRFSILAPGLRPYLQRPHFLHLLSPFLKSILVAENLNAVVIARKPFVVRCGQSQSRKTRIYKKADHCGDRAEENGQDVRDHTERRNGNERFSSNNQRIMRHRTNRKSPPGTESNEGTC